MNEKSMQPGNKCPQCGAAVSAGAPEGLCPACLLKQAATADSQPRPPHFDPPSIEDVAKLFPQLEILSLLGKGGMGAVYKARQPALDRVVALKILPALATAAPVSPPDKAENRFAERFNREARALAKLSHPNIVA
jgi:serine/threonine protein kinase